MWYFAVTVGRTGALVTAGLIQVLCFEAEFNLDESVLPHAGLLEEGSKTASGGSCTT